mmetsp:Transcript_10189/g.25248  ORF Transcript_10189/g.25248 Transcript_10189/m.25248 type:complete len:270 (+) Transcript_10189:1400-2209(+)
MGSRKSPAHLWNGKIPSSRRRCAFLRRLSGLGDCKQSYVPSSTTWCNHCRLLVAIRSRARMARKLGVTPSPRQGLRQSMPLYCLRLKAWCMDCKQNLMRMRVWTRSRARMLRWMHPVQKGEAPARVAKTKRSRPRRLLETTINVAINTAAHRVGRVTTPLRRTLQCAPSPRRRVVGCQRRGSCTWTANGYGLLLRPGNVGEARWAQHPLAHRFLCALDHSTIMSLPLAWLLPNTHPAQPPKTDAALYGMWFDALSHVQRPMQCEQIRIL